MIATQAMKKMFYKVYCYNYDIKKSEFVQVGSCDLRKFKIEPTLSHGFLSSIQRNPMFVLIGKKIGKNDSVVLFFNCVKSIGDKIEPISDMSKEVKGMGKVGCLTRFGDRVIGIDNSGQVVSVIFK